MAESTNDKYFIKQFSSLREAEEQIREVWAKFFLHPVIDGTAAVVTADGVVTAKIIRLVIHNDNWPKLTNYTTAAVTVPSANPVGASTATDVRRVAAHLNSLNWDVDGDGVNDVIWSDKGYGTVGVPDGILRITGFVGGVPAAPTPHAGKIEKHDDAHDDWKLPADGVAAEAGTDSVVAARFVALCARFGTPHVMPNSSAGDFIVTWWEPENFGT